MCLQTQCSSPEAFRFLRSSLPILRRSILICGAAAPQAHLEKMFRRTVCLQYFYLNCGRGRELSMIWRLNAVLTIPLPLSIWNSCHVFCVLLQVFWNRGTSKFWDSRTSVLFAGKTANCDDPEVCFWKYKLSLQCNLIPMHCKPLDLNPLTINDFKRSHQFHLW